MGNSASLLTVSFNLDTLIVSMIVQLVVSGGNNLNPSATYNIALSFNEAVITAVANGNGRPNWDATDCAQAAQQVLGLPVSSPQGV